MNATVQKSHHMDEKVTCHSCRWAFAEYVMGEVVLDCLTTMEPATCVCEGYEREAGADEQEEE